MRKIGVILGALWILMGFMTLSFTSILQQLIPKLGYAAFQAHGGSYSPENYEMNFLLPNSIAVGLIILGAVMAVVLWRKKE